MTMDPDVRTALKFRPVRSIGQRRPDPRHEVYREPAVDAWEAAMAARRKSPEDLGVEWTMPPVINRAKHLREGEA